MEFACGFVYVPPLLNQRSCQQTTANGIKRSALLPPAHRLRPRSPPPSPPSPPSSPNSTEKSREAREAGRPPYENVDFQNKIKNLAPQPTPAPRRAALLPPCMRQNKSETPDPPTPESQLNGQDLYYSYCAPERCWSEAKPPPSPAVPQRPLFMDLTPEYVMVVSSPSSTSQSTTDVGPLPGNPNVVLVPLGRLLSEDAVQPIRGQPTICTQCGSVLNSLYVNVVSVCCFCASSGLTHPPSAYEDGLFLLNPDEAPLCTSDALLIFCIDISGSMSLTSKVTVGRSVLQKSRLQFVREAVLTCLERLNEQNPGVRVGLVTFNDEVTIHGHNSLSWRFLSGNELTDVDLLKNAAHDYPSPPPLWQTKGLLQKQVRGLRQSGPTALGPAALLSIAMAARQPGSKVIICTDGKANTDLGNLEVEDNDARTLLSSTIFYQTLGEYAADQGVTVSVLSIEGTDCRLDELGRLVDHTGGNVVIASPNMLQAEFEQMTEDRTIATHCAVTLRLPKSLRVRGEREAGSRATREVGNVDSAKELTFQFGAGDPDAGVPAPSSGARVPIQLQIRYRRRNGQKMLRVITSEREVTDDRSAALSSLSVDIVQLNSAQASATLAVRGRFLEARREDEQQRKLIARAIEHNHSAEDKHTYQQWVETMEPIYNNIHNYTRRKCVISDKEPLTDAGAAMLYTMKHSNRNSLSRRKAHQPTKLPKSSFYDV
ncbi:circularly permutated Ras protein 1-like isoform X2 [Betta splendens]|uniref:Circularly permutated Ras protein 1-like isoform X2 n=1 Tax=Betta splendens TaxID=158456 RepID=A0A6P7L5R5_BETSP|nr:circularly permutated Ras protein 1-like isoform X2 [Betta splendens]